MSNHSGRRRIAGLPHWDRCAVMGVVNVTPDSFSDGGRWFDTTTAVKHGLDLVAQGADLVDVGGESTRPGATRVDEAEELKRVIPVVRGLAAEGVTVSVDTMRASVAEQSLAAGAALVNDVSGGLADPAMIGVVAAAGAPFVVMHWRGFLEGGNVRGVYDDVVTEVADELRARVEAVLEGGVAADRVIVDPGLGFSKDAGHDLALLARLDRLTDLGHPCSSPRPASGSSAGCWPAPTPRPRRPGERDAATAAVSALSAQAGAWAVRVHEVRASADAVRVVRAMDQARTDGPTPPASGAEGAR
ncbi:dihydropteroate synthase [Streptomyces albogriseolus]